jgi:hypothetical protein
MEAGPYPFARLGGEAAGRVWRRLSALQGTPANVNGLLEGERGWERGWERASAEARSRASDCDVDPNSWGRCDDGRRGTGSTQAIVTLCIAWMVNDNGRAGTGSGQAICTLTSK